MTKNSKNKNQTEALGLTGLRSTAFYDLWRCFCCHQPKSSDNQTVVHDR